MAGAFARAVANGMLPAACRSVCFVSKHASNHHACKSWHFDLTVHSVLEPVRLHQAHFAPAICAINCEHTLRCICMLCFTKTCHTKISVLRFGHIST